jgi:small subunit ribosomal protein S11e
MRYYKSIGLGFKTPKEAIEGSYVDKKCPFTGNVSIRGRILKAMVISTKMKRTVVIRRDYLQFVSKYRRFEKRHKNVSVHCSPCFLNVREGDVVTVGQCRPLAKTVRFNVLEHQPSVNKVSRRDIYIACMMSSLQNGNCLIAFTFISTLYVVMAATLVSFNRT